LEVVATALSLQVQVGCAAIVQVLRWHLLLLRWKATIGGTQDNSSHSITALAMPLLLVVVLLMLLLMPGTPCLPQQTLLVVRCGKQRCLLPPGLAQQHSSPPACQHCCKLRQALLLLLVLLLLQQQLPAWRLLLPGLEAASDQAHQAGHLRQQQKNQRLHLTVASTAGLPVMVASPSIFMQGTQMSRQGRWLRCS
jgi:hypothetical protein